MNVSTVLSLARAQLGKNRAKFLAEGEDPPQEWCAWFISWLAKKTGCASIPKSNSCTQMSNTFISNGKFFNYNYGQNKSKTPQPGNIIFYEWGNRADGPDHVGIVETVSGNTMTVIEGNNSSTSPTSVAIRTVNFISAASQIYGWGLPDYSDTNSNGQTSDFIGPINQTLDSAIISDEGLGYEVDFEKYYDEYKLRYNIDKREADGKENEFFTEDELVKVKEMTNLRGIIGLPPQFSATTDTRMAFAQNSNGEIDRLAAFDEAYLGTDYTSSIATKMPLIFISPCEPVFLPTLGSSKKKDAISNVIQQMAGDKSADLEGMIGNYSGKMYATKYAYAEYFKYVNPMCRVMSKYLGLTEEHSPYCAIAREFNTDTYNWGRNYMDSSDDGMKEILETYKTDSAKDNIFAKMMMHRASIPFYANAEPSVQEEFSNETTQSMLNSGINSLSDQARELQYILGLTTSQVGINFDKLKDNLASSRESLDKFVSGLPVGGNVFSVLINSLNTVISGGRLIFPEIWSDSSFARSYNITMKLISPSPDKFSIWKYILVPLAHIYGLVCPRQADKHGYSAPFVVKAFCKGLFNIDMGIVTGVTVTKGKENTWNKDGLPTYVEVSMTIKDLYSVLSMTSMSDIKFDTMNNIAEMDFLANACGVNFNVPDTERYIEMFLLMNGITRIYDFAGNTSNNLTEWGINKATNIIRSLRGIRGVL